MDYRQGYCNTCQRPSKLERKSPNHLLHVVLTVVLGVLTLPLAGIGALFWILIWVMSSVRFGGWSCHQCGGNKVKSSVPKDYAPPAGGDRL